MVVPGCEVVVVVADGFVVDVVVDPPCDVDVVVGGRVVVEVVVEGDGDVEVVVVGAGTVVVVVEAGTRPGITSGLLEVITVVVELAGGYR